MMTCVCISCRCASRNADALKLAEAFAVRVRRRFEGRSSERDGVEELLDRGSDMKKDRVSLRDNRKFT